ncbi:MAG TPA: DUF4386 family protein [Terriglobales bacterium]
MPRGWIRSRACATSELSGYLIFKSTFMPRILGVLLAIDGLGWVSFIYPPLGSYLFPAIAVASGLAEIPLQLWLIIMGVNNQRWMDQARAAWQLRLQRGI